jgi:putative intracellular protease/amidase
MPSFNVAILLYPNADIVDFSGPLEIFSCSAYGGREKVFNTTTFSFHNPITVGAGNLTVVPQASLNEIESKLEEYDILVVPGGAPEDIKEMLAKEEGKAIVRLIQRFVALEPRKEQGHRIALSVCTGALVLAAANVLKGRTVTTHHIAYELIEEMADEAAGGESGTKCVKKRWVDAGKTEAGVRIVNAGGVTSGIDASLFVVELVAGKEGAQFAADLVEFERRGQDDAWVAK